MGSPKIEREIMEFDGKYLATDLDFLSWYELQKDRSEFEALDLGWRGIRRAGRSDPIL